MRCTARSSGASEHADPSALLCAVTHTVSCDAEGDCVEGPANAINLLVFLDFRPGEKIANLGHRANPGQGKPENPGQRTIPSNIPS